jgi:hypothetical protein
MAKQAKEIEDRYKQEKMEDLETGEILEYQDDSAMVWRGRCHT